MNRYIKAMEIGNARDKEGITYYELKEKLDIEFGVNSETTFIVWFLNNFKLGYDYIADTSFGYSQLQRYVYKFVIDEHVPADGKFINIEKALKEKSFLSGEASKQYLDYLELKESRESSQLAIEKAEESIKIAKKSTRFAGWALVIAIITSVASIGFSIANYFKEPIKYPQPPYDVNVSNKSLDVKVSEPVKIRNESDKPEL